MNRISQLRKHAILNIILSFSMIGLCQDWLGLEKYVEFVQGHWVNIPWFIWLVPIILCIIIITLDYKTVRTIEALKKKRDQLNILAGQIYILAKGDYNAKH